MLKFLKKRQNNNDETGALETNSKTQVEVEPLECDVKQENEEKENPLSKLGAVFGRLVGDYPMNEDIPLTESKFKKLFSSRTAFVDYLPFMSFDDQNEVVILDDGVSCGAVFRVYPIDVDGRGEDVLFHAASEINTALQAAPIDDDYPYTIQIYMEDKQPQNLADLYRPHIAKHAQGTKLTETFLEVMNEHSSLMNNSTGLFSDDRILDSMSPKGWRAIDRQIILVIYRKAPKAVWDKESDNHSSQFEFFSEKISAFISQLTGGVGLKINKMNENDIFQWLAPIFNPTPLGWEGSAVDWAQKNNIDIPNSEKGASWDLAQIICPEPPKVINDYDAKRGIMKFGNQYSRFITLQPVHRSPDIGIYTTDIRKGKQVIASSWDKMPADSWFVFTITPLASHVVERQLDNVIQVSNAGSGHEAQKAYLQASEGKKFLSSGSERIYNFHAGVYVKAHSIKELDQKYHAAISILNSSRTMNAISEENDLIATDSYIRNLPFVYDYKFDQRHSKRAFKTYTSHIACVLPFYGRPTTDQHFCFLNYNRSGELVPVDPFQGDRARVAHSLTLGPTGAGKSATQVAQAIQSMAVKRPRQFFIDKGGSFALTAAYYEAHGLNVRRIVFHNNSNETLAPYAETYSAINFLESLREEEEKNKLLTRNQKKFEKINSDQTLKTGNVFSDDEDDDERDYLGEMMNVTLLMITGGKLNELEKLNQFHIAFIQEALINALYYAKNNDLPHALPAHVAQELHEIASREKQKDAEIGRTLYQLAMSMEAWTRGTQAKFFNQYSEPFDDKVDATFLELGVIANEGNEAMLAVAISTLISNITQIGEKHQHSGRHIDVFLDECHYVTANELLVDSVVVGVKVWRKISIWLHLATQNITDFPNHAAKILALLEWWWLLAMQPDDARALCDLKHFDQNTRYIMDQCSAKPPYYVEAVMISDKFTPMIIRLIPPSLYLALGKTDGNEKKKLMELSKELNVSHLEAAMIDAKQTTEFRRSLANKLKTKKD